jgi:hypothetical protein
MLNHLYRDLLPIIMVKTLSESSDGSVNIQYYEDNQPSLSQIEEINTILNAWPLQKLKIQKMQILDNVWKEKVKDGWETPSGYSLGIDVSDITLLNGAFTLAKEANNIGINDLATIVDKEGQSHSMNLQDLTLLMLQYGQARSILSNSYASIKQSINAATSSEELASIDITI